MTKSIAEYKCVPAGSVTIYIEINDLPLSLNKANTTLLAVDANLLMCAENTRKINYTMCILNLWLMGEGKFLTMKNQ